MDGHSALDSLILSSILGTSKHSNHITLRRCTTGGWCYGVVKRSHGCILRQNASIAFCLMSWPASDGVVRHSPITKRAARISQERFDLDSPNFTRTSGLQPHWIWRYFWSEVSRKDCENTESNGFGSKFSRMSKGGLHNFTHLSGTIIPANLQDMTSRSASGRLQKSN